MQISSRKLPTSADKISTAVKVVVKAVIRPTEITTPGVIFTVVFNYILPIYLGEQNRAVANLKRFVIAVMNTVP